MIDLDSLLPVTQPRFPEEFLGYLDGTPTWNHATQAWDVDGDMYLFDMSLAKIPVQFGRVTRDFDCSRNHLTSLAGAPQHVAGDFYCYANLLPNDVAKPPGVQGEFRP